MGKQCPQYGCSTDTGRELCGGPLNDDDDINADRNDDGCGRGESDDFYDHN